jgi:excisionase family DNA binding protein
MSDRNDRARGPLASAGRLGIAEAAPDPASTPGLPQVLADLAGLIRELRDRHAAPPCATFTARELAEFLGISLSTVERLKSAGALPAPVEIGAGCHRWRRAEIEEWLRAGCPPRKVWEAMRR